MTFEEAKAEAKAGHKIVHEYFCDGEFFEWNGRNLVCEMGYDMSRWYTGQDWQETGWRLK